MRDSLYEKQILEAANVYFQRNKRNLRSATSKEARYINTVEKEQHA